MSFKISENKSCDDDWCFNGVIMDTDEFYEGYERDVIYPPCKCNPKYCDHCEGAGHLYVPDGSIDCENCNYHVWGTGDRHVFEGRNWVFCGKECQDDYHAKQRRELETS